MNYFTTILFVIFIFPAAWKEYKKDNKKHMPAKYINIILSVVIFSIYTNIVRAALRGCINDYEALQLTYQIGASSFGMIIWFFYVFLSLIISVLIIAIALRKERARVFFLRILPFIWILGSVQLYKFALTVEGLKPDNLFLYSLLIEGVLALVVFLIYNSRFMKRFFQFKTQGTLCV